MERRFSKTSLSEIFGQLLQVVLFPGNLFIICNIQWMVFNFYSDGVAVETGNNIVSFEPMGFKFHFDKEYSFPNCQSAWYLALYD